MIPFHLQFPKTPQYQQHSMHCFFQSFTSISRSNFAHPDTFTHTSRGYNRLPKKPAVLHDRTQCEIHRLRSIYHRTFNSPPLPPSSWALAPAAAALAGSNQLALIDRNATANSTVCLCSQQIAVVRPRVQCPMGTYWLNISGWLLLSNSN